MFIALRYVLAAICLASVASVLDVKVCRGEALRLLEQHQFTCRDLSEAVNYFVQLGEMKAIFELQRLGEDDETDPHRFERIERLSWICRILYERKDGKAIPMPWFGALFLPPMSSKDWPLCPVVKSGSSYFVLSEGYLLAGYPEPLDEYIERCRSAGKFRTATVPVPKFEESTKDLDELLRSDKWAAIRWDYRDDRRFPPRGEASSIEFLKQQLGEREDSESK